MAKEQRAQLEREAVDLDAEINRLLGSDRAAAQGYRARQEIREGTREVAREKREARREIRRELREEYRRHPYWRNDGRYYRDGRYWDPYEYERRYYGNNDD